MGHEYCGIVEEVGSDVKLIKPGQLVIGSFFASDNTWAPQELGAIGNGTFFQPYARALWGLIERLTICRNAWPWVYCLPRIKRAYLREPSMQNGRADCGKLRALGLKGDRSPLPRKERTA
jgi:hypothetical protein